MDTDKLKTQITTFLELVKIPDEEKSSISQKLNSLEAGPLQALRDNLAQQLIADVYYDFTDGIKNEEQTDETTTESLKSQMTDYFAKLPPDLFTAEENQRIQKDLSDLTSSEITMPVQDVATTETPQPSVVS